jgi:hypothetical protein
MFPSAGFNRGKTMLRLSFRIVPAVSLAVLLVLTPGCGGEGADSSAPPPAGDGKPQVALTAPLSADSGELPPGHPPLDEAAGGAGMATLPAAQATGDSRLQWSTPAGWVEEQPSSNMRIAQYRVPGAGGDAECVVFYFGPGQGGDPMANAVRWAGQFSQADGRNSTEVMKTDTQKIGDRSVLTVEVTGTYTNPMTDNVARPDQMLLGAIVEGPDANWFFKLTGPESTVSSERAAFEKLIGSVQ